MLAFFTAFVVFIITTVIFIMVIAASGMSDNPADNAAMPPWWVLILGYGLVEFILWSHWHPLGW
jgi:hypothetical protein